MQEANVTLVGGHSVDDPRAQVRIVGYRCSQPAEDDHRLRCKTGNYLVLTKPLGTGIIATALKGEFLSPQEATETFRGWQS